MTRIEAQVGLLALLVAIFGAALSYWSAETSSAQLLRERRLYAADVVKQWDEMTRGHKSEVEKHFPGLYSTTGAAISKDKARELYAAGNSDSPNYHVRRAIVSLLNYFEFIGLACEWEIADRQVIDRSLRSPMKRWYDILKPFLAVYEQERGTCIWGPYENLVAEWEGRNRPCVDMP